MTATSRRIGSPSLQQAAGLARYGSKPYLDNGTPYAARPFQRRQLALAIAAFADHEAGNVEELRPGTIEQADQLLHFRASPDRIPHVPLDRISGRDDVL
ncbi:hypothetical protein LPJ38_21030 [Bradyrhizobium daqingense]|uniref:hypothetical protein n=1 Tax=Bradyrhizobium daqingense TaxID=993502 RepID=UPI0013151D9F|nr:hypothetical protein [Bradyrhizobium daqingense]UFS86168.1 hypothetical protein LPJ38_21030 [Bradyrhizobium daqingense]